MEIGAVSSQYLDSSYVPFSIQEQGTLSKRSDGFAEILKQAQKAQLPQGSASQGAAPQGDAPQSATALPGKNAIDKNDKLYELCMELETFLIKNLIKSMRGTVQKSKLIDTGFAGEIYEDMLYDEYAKDYARNANFGFAEMAYRDLKGLR